MLSMDERKVPVSTWVLPTRVPTETWEQPGLQGPTACGAPGARCGRQGRSARAPSDPRVGSECQEEKPLCTDRPEGRPAPQRRGVGRTSWRRGLVPGGLPCSPARFGGPTRGTRPPTARERPEELEPRRPGPSASRRPGTRTRDAPSTRLRARPACSPTSRVAVGSSARPAVHTFRTGAGRRRAPSSQPPGRRVRLHPGARPSGAHRLPALAARAPGREAGASGVRT